MSTEVFNLADFDSYREDNRLEVKKAKGGLPLSLWETYSAMANTYGGCIILGVIEHADHSWSTCGLKDVSKLKKDFWDTVNNVSKVSINLLKESDVTDYEHNGDVILVIKIPRAVREIRPVYINNNLMGGTFKRNWEGDYHCTAREIKAMLRDQADDSSDMKVLENQELEDLDADSISSYRSRYNIRHEASAWTKLSDFEFLERIGAAKIADDGRLHPTSAGLLMFGQEYKILYEYPEYFLDFREHMDLSIRWTDRIQSQSGDWSGNMFDFFARVSSKLVLDLKKPFKLVNMVRIDETPVHDAVREALVNCLVNADFYEPRGVVVDKYLDHIILKNPGTVIVGKNQMLKGGESEPRHGSLMKMFNLIGYGERAGSGVPNIYAVWNDEGLEEPFVEEVFGSGQPNRTIVTLPLTEKGKADFQALFDEGPEKGPEKGPENLKEQEIQERSARIIELVKNNPYISRAKMAQELNITEKQVRTVLDALKASGAIHHEGPAKGGRWIAE